MLIYLLWFLSCLSPGCVFLWKREAAMSHHESLDPFFRFVIVFLTCDTAKALGLVLSPSCHLPHSNRNRARVPRVCCAQDISLQRKRQLWLPARLCDGGIQTFPLWEHWKLVHKASLQRWAHPIPQKAAIKGNSATLQTTALPVELSLLCARAVLRRKPKMELQGPEHLSPLPTLNVVGHDGSGSTSRISHVTLLCLKISSPLPISCH